MPTTINTVVGTLSPGRFQQHGDEICQTGDAGSRQGVDNGSSRGEIRAEAGNTGSTSGVTPDHTSNVEGVVSTTHSSRQSWVSGVFENRSIWSAVTSFQHGASAADFWNGDIAAAEGHLSLMESKRRASDPLSYSHLAMNRAAKEGRLDVVRWLHAYTNVPQTHRAMDSAAAGGHLEVSAANLV